MRNRRDNNHAEIRDALRSRYFVWDMADVKNGFPDLLVVSTLDWVVLLEVKLPGEKLTPKEVEFHKNYPAPLHIVHSVEEAYKTMEDYDR